ncbi:MAG TPA: hypothetical protein VMZ31_19220 [Phycisphaerae bacterium]|nr:hypothetical protein [Phycisphaerae bacterium]
MDYRGFALSVLRPGSFEKHVAFEGGVASAWGLSARLEVSGNDLKLSIEGRGDAVVTLWLQPEMSDPFPFVPGFLLGYNRPEDTGPGYPQLTDDLDLTPPNLKNPFWGIRADRATAPVVFLFGREGMRALAVPPYTRDVGNGLRVCKKRGIGISVGHVVEPVQFVHDSTAAPGYRGYVRLDGALELAGHFFQSDRADRRGHAEVIRFLYNRYHDDALRGEGPHSTVRLLADAIVRDILLPARAQYAQQTGGELFKITDHRFGRTVPEIGWTGGAMVAYPFLATQNRYLRKELAAYAIDRLDRICRSINPDSGLFWDCQDTDGFHCRGWWTYISPEAHYAYNQGHACYYLLKSSRLVPSRADDWGAAAQAVLDRIVPRQLGDGRFPVSFAIEDGRPFSQVGFAGCWFAAALAWMHRITGQTRYLDAAIRAALAYHQEVATLSPCGTPMDTHNAADEEGNLALLHTLPLLHEATGDARFIEMLRDSADFEMTWRYYYNTRPIIPPLDEADWASCGGSVTSAHNPHIHPMHLNALDQVLYLHDHVQDDYYLERTRDAVGYGCCCVCRESEDFGWGKPGWLCERFCPSDGLLIQPDLKTAEPRSVGCDYHPWVVAVTLEGLTGQAWDRFADL